VCEFISLRFLLLLMAVLRNTFSEYVSDLLTRLRAGRPRNLGSIPGTGKKFSASSKRPYVSAASSSVLVSDYTDTSFRGVKRPGRKADNSSLSSAETKNVELYLNSPHMPKWRTQGQLCLFFFLPLPCVSGAGSM